MIVLTMRLGWVSNVLLITPEFFFWLYRICANFKGRTEKIGSQGKEMHSSGTDVKGYLYNPQDRSVFYSRDVVFDENDCTGRLQKELSAMDELTN